MTIEELQDLNKRLTALLDDPQPGLFTWCEMLWKVLAELGSVTGLSVKSHD